MYMKQIEQLVVLQGVDNEILEIEAKLAKAPKELEKSEEQLEELEEKKAVLEEKVELLKDQKSKLEKDIEDDDFKIKKSKNKLMMVENTKEYHAMMREMDNLEKMNRLREEERVALVEELKNQELELEEVTSQHKELSKEIEEKKVTIKKESEKSKKSLESLRKKREKASKDIPPPIMSRYNFIRSRIQNPVIVSVTKGICNGCHISIPPQSFIELQKGEQILSCPNCQRLIYWDEHFESTKKA